MQALVYQSETENQQAKETFWGFLRVMTLARSGAVEYSSAVQLQRTP